MDAVVRNEEEPQFATTDGVDAADQTVRQHPVSWLEIARRGHLKNETQKREQSSFHKKSPKKRSKENKNDPRSTPSIQSGGAPSAHRSAAPSQQQMLKNKKKMTRNRKETKKPSLSATKEVIDEDEEIKNTKTIEAKKPLELSEDAVRDRVDTESFTSIIIMVNESVITGV